MEYPLVSVVIPIYNMQVFLADTIESVMQSTYPNFEVILMDDGSKDNSPMIAKSYADKDLRIRFFSQKNGGASAARNQAIKYAKGEYILPVDADNLISPDYILKATQVLRANEHIKVVSCEAVFIGEKQGRWEFPDFSNQLLARKNLIDNCAMYRKADWGKCGGYCEEIMGREDWDFWISIFKGGGDFLRLPIVGLHYRVRSNSKKIATRHLKRTLIKQLNARHKMFFYKMLGGKLRFMRTWSSVVNFCQQIILPEIIYTNPKFLELEEFVYNSTETWLTNARNSDNNVIIEFENYRLMIRKKMDKSYFDSSEAQKLYAQFEENQRVGYYEKRTVFGCTESYFIQLI